MKPPNSGHALNSGQNVVPNVTIFFKLPPNSGHLSITDKFLRPVDVRYSEVSPYFANQLTYEIYILIVHKSIFQKTLTLNIFQSII